MILSKLNKIIFVFFLFFMTQCYKAPFFDLTVQVVDQSLSPVPNTSIIIEVTDLDNGDPINGSIIYFESTTNNEGLAQFSFENKAFITARACLDIVDNDAIFMCKEGHVYLEENMNKGLTLMVEGGNCIYCLF